MSAWRSLNSPAESATPLRKRLSNASPTGASSNTIVTVAASPPFMTVASMVTVWPIELSIVYVSGVTPVASIAAPSATLPTESANAPPVLGASSMVPSNETSPVPDTTRYVWSIIVPGSRLPVPI